MTHFIEEKEATEEHIGDPIYTTHANGDADVRCRTISSFNRRLFVRFKSASKGTSTLC
jgi:hypothetical protein